MPRVRLPALRDAVRLRLGLGLLAVLGLAWSLLALPLRYLLPPSQRQRLGRHGASLTFRVYLQLLTWIGACRFDLRALDALRDQPACIIAPNHPSLLDAVMVISRVPHVACVMKAGLMRNILFGAGARLARYIRNDSLHAMVRRAVTEVRGGSHLLLFPEGTRTTRAPVNRLQGTAGLIAKYARAPVQTVFIETTDAAFLGKESALFRRTPMPVSYRIRLGRRFDPPKNVA
ncbi:MAG TPA: lysophospholipid acyltransferase family protein, partial [Rhodanobacter sp.]|nr:lysophospholipid acyltransferase family protein [Rhodanobacter sp.]